MLLPLITKEIEDFLGLVY